MKRTARVYVQLAFVPLIPEGHTEEYWWPALVYPSYAHAMAERRGTLSSSTTEMMLLKQLAEHKRNYGPGSSGPPSSAAIAQFLGFEDKWSEFTQHRNAFAFVRTAVVQKIKMTPQCLHDFNLALEQAESLAECDATDTTQIASVLKKTTYVDPNMQQQTAASETTRATPTPAASMKSSVSGPTQGMGRKEQARKKEHHSTCIKKDKHKRRAQLPKRKAP
ncbi:hypothetical protein MHU86_16921 [Fragilaria crotonensis]|nr:hypothetical protein MHU86_16921 [Fragilaria crotonensis]